MVIPVSVITPASRGADVLATLLNDFRNQTFKAFEHIIVYDGTPPQDVVDLMAKDCWHPHTRFIPIEKDTGDMKIAPGTRPRNHGVSLATGDWCCFCDDDDRYKDSYLETFVTGLQDNMINVVQMSCQESRMYKNGREDHIVLIPEVGLPGFPICCHVGTPCFLVKREWALQEPWQHEPEHDFRFIKRIVHRFKPTIRVIPGMQVDVDGLVIQGMKDWVSIPPLYRDEGYHERIRNQKADIGGGHPETQSVDGLGDKEAPRTEGKNHDRKRPPVQRGHKRKKKSRSRRKGR